MPLTPNAEAAYSRTLTFVGRLLEALEDLDGAGGLKCLSPAQAARLIPLLHDVKAEAEAVLPVLEHVATRPDRRGTSRREDGAPRK